MAESVMLTPEEQRWLKPLFDQYDLEDSDIVMGEQLRPLLEKSGLPPQQLSQIWQIVDTENRGFLDFSGFAKILRLVYHAQHGLPLSPRLANIPAGPPDFNRPQGSVQTATAAQPAAVNHQSTGSFNAMPTQPLAAFSTGGSTFSANGETKIPPMTTADKKRFGSLFDQYVGPSSEGFIEGPQARDIFLKARLPQETLGKVWSLIDVDGRGKLTKNEFVVAMHLIQALISKSMTNLPSALPASWQPWLGSGHARQASIATGSQSINPAAVSSPPPPPPPSQTQASKSRVASVAIAPNERAQFDAIFDSLDHSRTGILGPQEAVPVLMKSGLSEEVLAKVWDLADTRGRGQLDKGDFALAMHFVKAKLNGYELPDQVMAGAGDAMHSQQTQAPAQVLSPQSTAQAPPAAPVSRAPAVHPTGATSPPEPHVPKHSATQVSAGSLSDLVSLDNAVFKPLEPVKPRRAATEVDEKKFTPTSSFGQQLLKRQQQLPTHVEQPESPEKQPTQAKSLQSPPLQSSSAAPQTQQVTGQRGIASPQVSTGFPQATGLQEQQRNATQLESQITASKAEHARANKELATVLKNKADLENRLKELKTTYDTGTKQVHDTQQQIKAAREEVKQLEREIALRTSGLDAIKSQHAQERQTLEGLLAEKARLTEEHDTHAKTLEGLQSEISSFKEQHDGHQREISDHQTRFASLQSNIEAAKWQRQKFQEEAEQHRLRAQQAREDAEALQRRAEEEAAATAKAEAEAKAAHQAISHRSADLPIATAQMQSPESGNASSRNAPLSGVTNPQMSVEQARSLSIGSGTGSVEPPKDVDTPRTSPPTSETNYSNVVDNGMPAFTLPMQRPQSTSSSVVNNAPQSVRGDLESETSGRPTPEFPARAMNEVESSPLDLGSENSFEFVDARGNSEPLQERDGLTSSDDEGPVTAIPQKYGQASPRPPQGESAQVEGEALPPMPGTFPSHTSADEATRLGSGPKEEPAPSTGSSVPRDIPKAVSSASAQTGPAIDTESKTQSSSNRDQSLPPSYSQANQTSAVPMASKASTSVPSRPVNDEFDEFDDLEDAKEDEGEDDSGLYQPGNQSNAGPDEWQQLFANTQPPVAPYDQHSADPYASAVPAALQTPQESRELAELTSMGFSVDEARNALNMHGHNLSEATNYLLDNMR